MVFFKKNVRYGQRCKEKKKAGEVNDCKQIRKSECENVNIEVFDVYKGGGTLSFGNSPADRLCEIPIKQVTGGFYFESQFTLGDGDVVHDYLA